MIGEGAISEYPIGESGGSEAANMGTITFNGLVIRDPRPDVSSVTAITAGQTFTITITGEIDLTGASTFAATIDGVACSNPVVVDADEITFTAPANNIQLGTNLGLVVTVDGYVSQAYQATVEGALGDHADFTVDYANLHPDSELAGDTDFSAIVTGDQIEFTPTTTPGGYPVSISGDGLVTITGLGGETTPQEVDYAIIDASDNYARGTVGTWTFNAPPAPSFLPHFARYSNQLIGGM